MIQRIQSIYLLFTGIISGGLVFIFDLWIDKESQTIGILQIFNSQDFLLKGIAFSYILIAFLAMISLFSFKKRKLQISINRFNILINLILLSLLAYHLLNLSGETKVLEKGIGSFLPLVSIALLLLANRAIQKDEDLVKSVDRLR
jgi:O-antigen ligase